MSCDADAPSGRSPPSLRTTARGGQPNASAHDTAPVHRGSNGQPVTDSLGSPLPWPSRSRPRYLGHVALRATVGHDGVSSDMSNVSTKSVATSDRRVGIVKAGFRRGLGWSCAADALDGGDKWRNETRSPFLSAGPKRRFGRTAAAAESDAGGKFRRQTRPDFVLCAGAVPEYEFLARLLAFCECSDQRRRGTKSHRHKEAGQ